ncbi:conserved hypothetical protein [Beggiatoa sp. PS]|nr:conserved hypothetical protein [Beggiatoa sp. PS]
MSYSDFSVKKVKTAFQINIHETLGLFSNVSKKPISSHLQETLFDNVPLSISINTEKARSELVIAPVLVDIRKQYKKTISLFSGVELNIDKEQELNGFCDFIISQSAEQLYITAPIIMGVAAKNENIMSGLGQCIAEMIAARIFNENEGIEISKIYGIVTSGNLWKFLKLEDQEVYIDLDDYGIKEIETIMGILSAMIEQKT